MGEEGEGYRIALSNLESWRIGIAAQAVGMAQAAFEAALSYARDRVAFGKPVKRHPELPPWRHEELPPVAAQAVVG